MVTCYPVQATIGGNFPTANTNTTEKENKMISNQEQPAYLAPCSDLATDELVRRAIDALTVKCVNNNDMIAGAADSKRLATLHLAAEQSEQFCVMWLTNQHQLITFEKLFFGTIDSASVHCREVVRAALHHNAAAAIVCHNHPSGDPEASRSDKAITEKLIKALGLIDVRVLDHIIVGGTETFSFSEMGII